MISWLQGCKIRRKTYLDNAVGQFSSSIDFALSPSYWGFLI